MKKCFLFTLLMILNLIILSSCFLNTKYENQYIIAGNFECYDKVNNEFNEEYRLIISDISQEEYEDRQRTNVIKNNEDNRVKIEFMRFSKEENKYDIINIYNIEPNYGVPNSFIGSLGNNEFKNVYMFFYDTSISNLCKCKYGIEFRFTDDNKSYYFPVYDNIPINDIEFYDTFYQKNTNDYKLVIKNISKELYDIAMGKNVIEDIAYLDSKKYYVSIELIMFNNVTKIYENIDFYNLEYVFGCPNTYKGYCTYVKDNLEYKEEVVINFQDIIDHKVCIFIKFIQSNEELYFSYNSN